MMKMQKTATFRTLLSTYKTIVFILSYEIVADILHIYFYISKNRV